MSEKFHGKYRGLVLNNIDPMQINRLQVQVPDVAGLIHRTSRRRVEHPAAA